jgi:hypothetical protein
MTTNANVTAIKVTKTGTRITSAGLIKDNVLLIQEIEKQECTIFIVAVCSRVAGIKEENNLQN